MNKLENRSLLDEFPNFGSRGLDLGHPLLNHIGESFVKAAGIGAAQAVVRDSYSLAFEGEGSENGGMPTEMGVAKKNRFPDLRGETNTNTVEAMIKHAGKEGMQWGLAAGMYSGLTFGVEEALGVHDWKTSALAGAVTGAAMALTTDDHSHAHIVRCAITGAAISAVGNVLTGIF